MPYAVADTVAYTCVVADTEKKIIVRVDASANISVEILRHKSPPTLNVSTEGLSILTTSNCLLHADLYYLLSFPKV